jgi:hypothetical protein
MWGHLFWQVIRDNIVIDFSLSTTFSIN